jgi:hypothetical protein
MFERCRNPLQLIGKKGMQEGFADVIRFIKAHTGKISKTVLGRLVVDYLRVFCLVLRQYGFKYPIWS